MLEMLTRITTMELHLQLYNVQPVHVVLLQFVLKAVLNII